MPQVTERIPPMPGITHNLENYEETYRTFTWEGAERIFSWAKTGRVNMAYECIDRHCAGSRKDKVALYYSDPTGRDEAYTYDELRVLSNKFGNVLRKLGVRKGDRVFLFLPRCPELYVACSAFSRSVPSPDRCSRRSWKRPFATACRTAKPWPWSPRRNSCPGCQ